MVYLGEDGLSVGARLCCVSGVELRYKGPGKQTDFYILGLRRQFCAEKTLIMHASAVKDMPMRRS